MAQEERNPDEFMAQASEYRKYTGTPYTGREGSYPTYSQRVLADPSGRESENVEDLLGVGRFAEPALEEVTTEMARPPSTWTEQDQMEYNTHRLFGTPERGPSLRSSTFRGSDTWSSIVTSAGNAINEVRTTMDLWLNPQKFPVREGTSQDEMAVIEGNKESRKFTGVVDAAALAQTGAYSRAAPGLVGALVDGSATTLARTTELAAGGASTGRPRVFNAGVGNSAVKIGDEVYTGMNHSDALERAAKRTGRTFDELAEQADQGWYIDGQYKTRMEVEGPARKSPPPKVRELPMVTEKGEAFSIRQNPDLQSQWKFIYKGEEAGGFQIRADNPQFPNQVTIDSLHSKAPPGTGLSAPAYNHFKELYGQIGQMLVPSESLTKASYNNWMKMDPELLARGNYKLQDDSVWVREPVDFSKPLESKLEKPELVSRKGSPDQAVMDFKFEEGGSPQAVYRRMLTNQISAGQNTTLAPPPGAQVDLSYAPQVGQKLAPKAGAAVAKAGEDALKTLKENLPDLQYHMESTGRSTYIQVKDKEGENILKIRLGDHAATRFDALSIDPVSGNTVDTALQALKYELGLLDQAPEVGWSYAPPHGMRSVINSEKGMNVFPQHRQIGGRAEYVRGGYSTSREPLRPTTHTIGTDIQWDLTAPLNRAAE